MWRYLELLPVDAPPARVAAGRLDAAAPRPTASARLSASTGSGSRTTPATRPSRSRTVRSRSPPRGRRDFGVDALACASTGNLAGATAAAAAALGLPAYVFIPADLETGQGRPRAGLRRDGRPDRGHVRRRQPAVPRGRRRDRLGLRQHQPAPVLRRGLQDARVRDRRVARLAVARTSSSRRSRRGRCSRSSRRASRSWPTRASSSAARSASSAARPPAALRSRPPGQGGDRRHRAGPRAGHDRPLARDRQPGRRPLLGRAGERDAAAPSRRSPTR